MLTIGERVFSTLVSVLAWVVIAAYFQTRFAPPLSPALVALFATAGGLGLAIASQGSARRGELVAAVAITVFVAAALIAMAWPHLLPIGTGTDLTHHFQMVDYIERHWRLPHSSEIG